MKKIPQWLTILSMILFLAMGLCPADPPRAATGTSAVDELTRTAKECPSDAYYIMTIVHPGRFLTDARAFLDALPIPSWQAEWNKMKTFSKEMLGHDLLDEAAWRAAGFDPDQPLRAELRSWPGQKKPMGFVYSAGLIDAAKVRRFLETKMMKDQSALQPTPGEPTLFRFVRSDGRLVNNLAVMFRGQRFFWLSWEASFNVSDPLQFLNRSTTDQMADTPAFRSAVERMRPDAVLAVYVNLRQLWSLDFLPDISPLLRELDGIGLTFRADGGETILAFRPDTGILPLLQPGRGVDGLQAGQPYFASRLNVSLADPVGFVRYAAEQWDPVRPEANHTSPLLREIEAFAREAAGMPMSAFQESLRGAELGLAFSANAAGGPGPDLVLTSVCRDEQLPAQIAKVLTGKPEVTRQTRGETTFFVSGKGNPKAVGLRGKTLALGGDVASLEKALQSTGETKSGTIPANEVLAVSELSAGEFLHLIMPQEAMAKDLPPSLLSDGSFTMTHTLRRSGPCLVIEHGGRSPFARVLASPAAMAALFGISSFFQKRQQDDRAMRISAEQEEESHRADVLIVIRKNLPKLAAAEARFFQMEKRYAGFRELVKKGLLEPKWDKESPDVLFASYSITMTDKTFRITARSHYSQDQPCSIDETGTISGGEK